MKIHRYISKYAQPDHKASLAFKVGLGVVLNLLLLGLISGMSIPVQAHALAYHPHQSLTSGDGNNPTTDDITTMIDQVFGPDAPAANRVAQCESSMNPNAYNPESVGDSHAEGLFQILYPSTWQTTPQASGSPYDAQANILAAHAIFMRDGQSWREWVCQP